MAYLTERVAAMEAFLASTLERNAELERRLATIASLSS